MCVRGKPEREKIKKSSVNGIVCIGLREVFVVV